VRRPVVDEHAARLIDDQTARVGDPPLLHEVVLRLLLVLLALHDLQHVEARDQRDEEDAEQRGEHIHALFSERWLERRLHSS
jgi:hypothetical protein